MNDESITNTPRRGFMGDRPQASEYMPEMKERVQRIDTATCTEEQHANNRQMRLPGF